MITQEHNIGFLEHDFNKFIRCHKYQIVLLYLIWCLTCECNLVTVRSYVLLWCSNSDKIIFVWLVNVVILKLLCFLHCSQTRVQAEPRQGKTI